MLLHTTRVSLEERLTTRATGTRLFTHEPTRDHADRALRHAHDLIVLLLHACNEFFAWSTPGADGLDAPAAGTSVLRRELLRLADCDQREAP